MKLRLPFTHLVMVSASLYGDFRSLLARSHWPTVRRGGLLWSIPTRYQMKK